MIITMDGPSASGKSTLARIIATQLGYVYINSGLLFRAVAYITYIRKGTIAQFTKEEIEEILLPIHFKYLYTAEHGEKIIYKGELLNPHLKTPAIDQYASQIAEQIVVRQELLSYQRELANSYNVIADGRDCGTVVFPHAEIKFYITASLETRALRIHNVQKEQTIEQCILAIQQRDDRDSKRAIAPLKPADDSFIIDTTHLSINQAVAAIIEILTNNIRINV